MLLLPRVNCDVMRLAIADGWLLEVPEWDIEIGIGLPN
jgi:hypothetical protein